MNESKRTPKQRAEQFVAALRCTRNDRGKLAGLRRGLSPGTVRDAWPIVAGLGGDIGQPVYVITAALFASHPQESNAPNFGETCRQIAQGDGTKIVDSFERRFRRLLASSEVEDVIGQLRSWVQLAAGKSLGVNYESLFADLWNWPWYADEIRVKWARAFWQSDETSELQPAPAATA
ncbi:MAG: type I-E CRISPR-associated protein Cse2/CasB [Verrucomicrobiota bacterium]|jgi:CRISPR type I-E-associated protein CasB/Cse2